MSEGNDEKVKQGYWLFTAAGERQELREIFALNDIRPYCIQHEVNDNHDDLVLFEASPQQVGALKKEHFLAYDFSLSVT
jgi:hypothetical protein